MSKIKVSPVLKRAASSPRISSLGDSDSGGLSPSALDKRRNKLGYQRISIACGECKSMVLHGLGDIDTDRSQDIAGGGKYDAFSQRRTSMADARTV